MKSVWMWFAIVLGILLIVFAIQNMAEVSVSFLGFEFTTRRFFLIAASVGVGFLLGKTIRFRRKEEYPIEEGDPV